MTARRSFRIALVLTAALGLQAASATPLRIGAELRAASCCAKHCQHARPIQGAMRCCQVHQAGDDTALSVAKIVPATAALSWAVIAPLPRSPEAVFGSPADVFERAAPIFLLTRSLRI